MILNTVIGLICTVACFHQAMGEMVTGYIGKSVVLKTGVNSSFVPSRIQWSIYTNTTIIIVWDQGYLNEKFFKYKGRLALDNSTGDLEIRNLKADDAMTYFVSLLSKDDKQMEKRIKLIVQENLSIPNITEMFSSFHKNDCIIKLQCFSSQGHVNLSWTTAPEFNKPFWSRNMADSSVLSVLWTSLEPRENVTFTCTASSGGRKTSNQLTVQCQGEEFKPVCQVCQCSRCRYGVDFSLALLCITIVTLLLRIS
ncbi:SLAM family member 5 [Salminus brasiliensis]|uniref:SLAM family member 5 n=1 Tax=Salminus brasiliensis TaxID=930266 RepID=UPI003B82FA92